MTYIREHTEKSENALHALTNNIYSIMHIPLHIECTFTLYTRCPFYESQWNNFDLKP